MIYQKLDILKRAAIIDEQAYNYSVQAITLLAAEAIDIDSDKAQVFITHLAMATMRLQRAEALEAIDAAVQAEIEAQPVYQQAHDLWQRIAQLSPIPFIAAEEGYVYLHMCALLTN